MVVSDVLAEVGEQTAAAIRDAGDRAAFCAADVSDPAAVDALMAFAATTFGGIDVVHNNAGIHEAMLGGDFSFESMAIETFDRVLAVNLRGAFLCAQRALPYLRESTRHPSVINAGSTASFAGYPFGVAYGTSKGGIALLTKNLAVALAPYGVRANCYCPASVDTPMVSSVTAAIVGARPEAPQSTRASSAPTSCAASVPRSTSPSWCASSPAPGRRSSTASRG